MKRGDEPVMQSLPTSEVAHRVSNLQLDGGVLGRSSYVLFSCLSRRSCHTAFAFDRLTTTHYVNYPRHLPQTFGAARSPHSTQALTLESLSPLATLLRSAAVDSNQIAALKVWVWGHRADTQNYLILAECLM